MSGFCGWFSKDSLDRSEARVDAMLAAHRLPLDAPMRRWDANAALAMFGSTARPQWHDEDEYQLIVAGHPRFADSSGAGTLPLGELARRLRAQGKSALEGLAGDFALAAFDRRSRRGLLAIDRIGVHHLVYTWASGQLVFGTSLDLLGGHPDVQRTLSPQALYDYLYYHVVPGPQTIYKDCLRLSPGHCLEFDPQTVSEPQPYWTMRFSEGARVGVDALKQRFMSILECSVRDAADTRSCGSFLSGGTDSSTVTGMLGRVSGMPAESFSIGFDVAGYDETGYARIAAKHFGSSHHEYFVTPQDVVSAVPKIATSYDQPFGNSSAVPTYYCAKLAHDHGIRRLLAGDGGDELFGGNERYAKQYLLSLYHRVPELLRGGLIEPALTSMPGIQHIAPMRKLRSYVEQARPSMPRRYESYNLLQHLGVGEVLDEDFLAGIDTEHPRALMVEAFGPFSQASLINQMLGIDLRFILADGDLPKVTHMCRLAGVDVTFPLLDDRLIEFSSDLPSDMKLRGTALRWFFKQALSDFLPSQIIAKQKHGFGLPVGHWLVNHAPLRNLAMQAIDLLRPRGMVRAGFIDDLMKRKLPEHPGYYGTMVWILMMLGLWLDSRRI
ncbi:asparagine synthase-related protein [uncultured Piscinibacter sp.]|uniref:asparagine synthetase B family protein n=1 Tax=uncultured Piscinibacter sp. TaxID=1131835 RepID=UPI0026217330|nr:asparagine synthase-related protein [uncultured Piscinibacter sp.]